MYFHLNVHLNVRRKYLNIRQLVVNTKNNRELELDCNEAQPIELYIHTESSPLCYDKHHHSNFIVCTDTVSDCVFHHRSKIRGL